jgi:poly-gamma-glutamate synthesis protein (capsule biosynthesis protein)
VVRRARALVVCLAATALIAGCSTGGGSSTAHSSKSPLTSRSHASASPSGPSSFTIDATGDLLIHTKVFEQAKVYGQASGSAYDFRPMFARVKPLLSSASLAVCHVETPMSADDTNVAGYPTFNTPHELAPAIKDAGWDSCSTASNHSYDEGISGINATLGALDAAGVTHAGTARSAEEGAHFEMHHIDGATVAMLSYTYGLNGVNLPADKPWLVNITDMSSILAAAHAARVAGADLVVVSMHWGTEYQVAPTAVQLSQAKTLLDSPDVDLILGDHVHVVQPIEKLSTPQGPKYVIYGLGNFVSNQSPAANLAPDTQDGIIVRATVSKENGRWSVTKVTYTPTYVEIGPYIVHPIPEDLADPKTPAALRSQLLASYRRTVAQVSSIPGHADDATPEPLPSGAG